MRRKNHGLNAWKHHIKSDLFAIAFIVGLVLILVQAFTLLEKSGAHHNR